MSSEKYELSGIEQYALMKANEEITIAHKRLRRLGSLVLRKFGVKEKDISKWAFSEDFSTVSRLKNKPSGSTSQTKK